ncbi:MAG: dockerin type I domain-containing protein [Acidobacteriota bacterium]
MNMRKICLIFFVSLGLIIFLDEIFAGTIKLSWDPVSDGSVAGYKVYFGYESGIYTYSNDVGNVTTYTLTNLQDCTKHYIAVTSYDFYGNESGYSNEVSGWPKPILEKILDASGSSIVSSAVQGETIQVYFKGTNFDEGAKPQFNPGNDIIVEFQRNSCDEIMAYITPDPQTGSGEKPAELGFREVIITNSDSIKSSPINFEIKLNENLLDTDNDGRIDGYDLTTLAIHFGTQEGDNNYEPSVDFNGDGWIDGDDLALLSSHFGENV